MKILAPLLLILTVAACSNKHSDIYVHNHQIYTTQKVSEFEVEHYTRSGNFNFLVINDEETMNDQERSQAIESLCSKYSIQCQKLNINKSLNVSAQAVVKTHKAFAGQKYFVFSPSPEVTAKYAGTLSMVGEKREDFAITSMMKSLGIEANTELTQKLIQLKK